MSEPDTGSEPETMSEPKLQSELFSVCQFFDSGAYEYVRRGVGVEEAVLAARHYTDNVAARLGLIPRVIIEDGDGFTVFEWKRGEGVTFPVEARGRV